MGHVGLTPQSVHESAATACRGAARRATPCSRTRARCRRRARSRWCSRACPQISRREITKLVAIPTIGIGAGVACDGQVLVMHDLLGLSDWTPSFVKRYANLGQLASQAARAFADDVRHRKFPGDEHSYRT